MKILKTVFVVALCAMFLFVFTACSNDSSGGSSEQSEAPQEITATVEETQDGEEIETVSSETTASDPSDASQEDEPLGEQATPVTQQYAGTVKEIAQEDGLYSYTISVNDGENITEITAAQNEDTIIADAFTGAPVAADEIKEDEVVVVYLSMMTTRSIPPIAQAYCIICNLPADNMTVPTYVEVAEAQINDDGDLTVLNQNRDLYVTIPSDVAIGIAGEDGEEVPFEQISEGTKLLAWFDAVMESYPAQATADRCVMCV